MSRKSNHLIGGILFILVCLFLAAVIYASLWSHPNHEATIAEGAAQTKFEPAVPAANLNVAGTAAVTLSSADGVEPTSRQQGAWPGSCVSDGCSWARPLDHTVIQSEPRGRLVEVLLQGGSSRSERAPIAWSTEAHHVYVFCSLQLPSVMIEQEQGWQVDTLDFIVGIPSVLDGSADIYAKICHPHARDLRTEAAALGYGELSESASEITVNNPQEIYRYVQP